MEFCCLFFSLCAHLTPASLLLKAYTIPTSILPNLSTASVLSSFPRNCPGLCTWETSTVLTAQFLFTRTDPDEVLILAFVHLVYTYKSTESRERERDTHIFVACPAFSPEAQLHPYLSANLT